MHIGINGQSLEGSKTGVGRVLFNVLKYWSEEKKHHFFIYFQEEIPRDLPVSGNLHPRVLEQKSSLLFNQLSFPLAAKKDGVEVLFCPAYQKPILFSLKSVLVVHDIIYKAHPEWYNWNSLAEKIIFKYIFKKSIQKASLIITPSQSSREEIKKFYNIEGDKIMFFYAAADDFLKFRETNSGIKDKLGLNKKFILMVGSIFIRRHPREVIQAFKKFAQSNKDWQLLIIGRDYTPFKIKVVIEKINQALRYQAILQKDFIDSDEDLRDLYNLANFSIYLSDYEGFGLPVIESMQCGTPVITSDKSSLKEIATGAAYLIKDNNSENEILTALKFLATNSQERKILEQKGFERARDFSWKKFAKNVLNAIENV